MGNDEPVTSALRRFVKLGGLMGRVGVSMLGNQIAGVARSDEQGQAQTTEALVRNATRVVKTLGEMKGAAMKVGQMLSLHDALLPPEVAAVLRTLQKQAPKVPAEVMEYEVRGAAEELRRPVREPRDRGVRRGVDRPGPHGTAARRPPGGGEDPVPADRPDHPGRPEEPEADPGHACSRCSPRSTSSRSGARCGTACWKSWTTATRRGTCGAWPSSTPACRRSSFPG